MSARPRGRTWAFRDLEPDVEYRLWFDPIAWRWEAAPAWDPEHPVTTRAARAARSARARGPRPAREARTGGALGHAAPPAGTEGNGSAGPR